MTKDGSRRLPTANGAVLADEARAGELLEQAGEAIFDHEFWRARNDLPAAGAGRGAAWFVAAGSWVLRHYRRGGLAARVSGDRYVWTGERRVRAFAEFRLLRGLAERGLPVPTPVGARYRRRLWSYRCDLITQTVEGALPMSMRLASGTLGTAAWRSVGLAVARLHAAGLDHADLNAHNILLSAQGAVSVIDLDRGRIRKPGAWAARNLERLRRSLAKISSALPADRFSSRDWQALLEGYREPGAGQ